MTNDLIDQPKCTDPVITPLAIWLNDACDDALRNELFGQRIDNAASDDMRIIATRLALILDWLTNMVIPFASADSARRVADSADKSACWIHELDSREAGADGVSRLRKYESDDYLLASRHPDFYEVGSAVNTAVYAAVQAADCAKESAESEQRSAEPLLRSCAELLDKMISV